MIITKLQSDTAEEGGGNNPPPSDLFIPPPSPLDLYLSIHKIPNICLEVWNHFIYKRQIHL